MLLLKYLRYLNAINNYADRSLIHTAFVGLITSNKTLIAVLLRSAYIISTKVSHFISLYYVYRAAV